MTETLEDYRTRHDEIFNNRISDIMTDLKNIDRTDLAIEKQVNGRSFLTSFTSDKLNAIAAKINDLHDEAIIRDCLDKVDDQFGTYI